MSMGFPVTFIKPQLRIASHSFAASQHHGTRTTKSSSRFKKNTQKSPKSLESCLKVPPALPSIWKSMFHLLTKRPPPISASAARRAKTFVVIKVPNHAGHFHPIHHLHSSFQQAHIPAVPAPIRTRFHAAGGVAIGQAGSAHQPWQRPWTKLMAKTGGKPP